MEIDSLPDEMLQLIFLKFDFPEQLAPLALVCTRWNSIFNEDSMKVCFALLMLTLASALWMTYCKLLGIFEIEPGETWKEAYKCFCMVWLWQGVFTLAGRFRWGEGTDWCHSSLDTSNNGHTLTFTVC